MMNDKEVIEKLNRDYLKCMNSKEYRLGSGLFGVINGLKGGRFREVRENIRTLWQGVRVQKYNSKTERYRAIRSEGGGGRIAVYSALFGGYDMILEPVCVSENCDYYIFTDQAVDADSIWKKVKLTEKQECDIGGMTDVEKNRFFKMLGYQYFSDYEYSIYIDANIEIYDDLSGFVVYADTDSGIAMYNHSARGCIYDEAKACVIMGKAKKKDAGVQMKRYFKLGMPKNYGMCECNVIVRKTSSQRCRKIMNEWWTEFNKSVVKRDQLVFPYILWKNGIHVHEIGCLGENVYHDGKFRVKRHI